MSRWSLYDLATGALTGMQVSDQRPDHIEQMAAAGIGLVAGEHDHMCRRVDLETGEVVDYQPPAPADTELQAWTWDAGTKRWVASPTLAALKAAKWALVRAQRDAVEFGGYAWDGSTFDSDSQSQSRIMGAVQMAVLAASAGQPFSIAWTLADNTARTLSGAEMIGVGLQLGVHVGTAHTIARALRELIEAATTAEELEAIEWP